MSERERDGEGAPGGEQGSGRSGGRGGSGGSGGSGGNGGSGSDRAHARIEAELAKLGGDLSAPAGWQARVLAAVAEPPRRRRWWWIAAPAFAAAVAIAIVVIWIVLRPPSGPSVAVELALASDPAGAPVRVRGTTANVGDVVTATARGDGKHRAVWIYRDRRELVVACPGAEGCQMTAGAPTAVARLELPGTYTIVALASSAPIPPPSPAASYDASMAAAATAGAVSRLETVTVR